MFDWQTDKLVGGFTLSNWLLSLEDPVFVLTESPSLTKQNEVPSKHHDLLVVL